MLEAAHKTTSSSELWPAIGYNRMEMTVDWSGQWTERAARFPPGWILYPWTQTGSAVCLASEPGYQSDGKGYFFSCWKHSGEGSLCR